MVLMVNHVCKESNEFRKQTMVVSVLNLFLSDTSVLIIINCFTLVFNGFNCKPYLKSKQYV